MTREELEQKVKDGESLQGADLSCVNLAGVNLAGVNLRYADMRGASLRGANLAGADMYRTTLRYADLAYADLSGVPLDGSDLRYADMRGANLRGADLRRTNLSDANIEGSKLPDYQICPEEGSFVAYKKLSTGVIAKLQIPEDAERTSSLVSRKCRASHVVVLEGSGFSPTRIESYLDYVPGMTVYADSFDPDPRTDCTHGIHFFMTRKEAEDWFV